MKTPAEEESARSPKEANETPNPGSESLKVYVRVRPRLKTEFVKEAAAFVDPGVTGKSH